MGSEPASPFHLKSLHRLTPPHHPRSYKQTPKHPPWQRLATPSPPRIEQWPTQSLESLNGYFDMGVGEAPLRYAPEGAYNALARWAAGFLALSNCTVV